ncbi:hypothetical protein P9112_004073 [Eukaryota sp. TZLM1-RC]
MPARTPSPSLSDEEPSTPRSTISEFASDLGGTLGFSIIATLADGILYAILLTMTEQITFSAAVASILGGIIHYSCCRMFVYARYKESVNPMYSLVMYFLVSWIGAGLHSLFVTFLFRYLSSFTSWFISKIVIFLCYTFPLSKFVVFSGGKPVSNNSDRGLVSV